MRLIRNPMLWIGLAVSAGALFLAFRGLRWAEVADGMAGANYGLLLLALAILPVAFYLRALRWAVLFDSDKRMSTGSLFGAINIGYAFNNLLPLRLGDLPRAYVVRETENVSGAHALSTIVVERVLDTVTVVALLMVTLPFIEAPAWATGPAVFLGLGVLGLAAVLAILSASRARVMPLVAWAVRFLPEFLREHTEQAVDSAIQGFTVLRRPTALVKAVAWSVASWVASALVIFVALRAFDLDLGFKAALFIGSATSLGMVVPSSPGYIGVFHAIVIGSLVNVFDADRNQAASFALVLHAMLYLTPIVIAGAFLWRERQVRRQVWLWVTSPTPAKTTVTAAGGSGGVLAE